MICDEGEEMSCVDPDCADQVLEEVCACVTNADICGDTCASITNLDATCSQYGISAICGGLIPVDTVYRDVCSGCPPETGRF